MANTYSKCKLCNQRFEVKDWHKGIERKINLLCIAKFKTIEKNFPKITRIVDYKFGLNYAMEQSYENTAKNFGISKHEVAKCETLFQEMCKYLHIPEKMEKWGHNEAVKEMEVKLSEFEKTLKIK